MSVSVQDRNLLVAGTTQFFVVTRSHVAPVDAQIKAAGADQSRAALRLTMRPSTRFALQRQVELHGEMPNGSWSSCKPQMVKKISAWRAVLWKTERGFVLANLV